jgi:hypothetical protein
MIWILLLLSQVLCGFQIVFFVLRHHIDLFVQISIAIPLGFGLSSLTFFCLSTFLGINILHLFLHISALSLLSFYLGWKSQILRYLGRFLHPNHQTIAFASISFFLTVWIVPPLYFTDYSSMNIAFGPALAEEISLMNSFYWGRNSGFAHPFRIRHPFCYHCVARTRWQTAFHSAMLRIGFASVRVCFTAPSFLLFFSICFSFCHFAKLFLSNTFLSLSSLFVFIFACGF